MIKRLDAIKAFVFAILAVVGCSFNAAAGPVSYEVLPFDVPAEMGSYTSAYGNNNVGVIVGNFGAPDGSVHGFIYQRGNFTDVVVPGAGPGDLGTLLDVNDSGLAVGVYSDADDNTYMYLREASGRITTLPNPAPDAIFAEGQGIDNFGTVVGFYIDGVGDRHGFIWRFGRYESYDHPGTARTVLTGINDKGDIVGYWRDAQLQFHGFVLRRGQTEPIDFPGALNTLPRSINNRGVISGYYRDAAGILHGFVYGAGEFTTLDFPGASDTTPFGMNDQGEIVGTYNEFSAGFVALPKRN